jgi:hypothetical protein
VGFVKVDLYKNGLTMISVPLTAADNRLNGDPGCIGDMIAEACIGGMDGGQADVIWKWDAASEAYTTPWLIDGWGGEYDGRWWDDNLGDYSNMMFDAGEACWVMRRDTGADVTTVTFLGWVPMADITTLTFVKGLTMFNWPYPTALVLNDSTLYQTALGGNDGGQADVVWEWDPVGKTYTTGWLIDGWGAPYDGKWWDDIAGDYSAIEFGPGKAFWFMRRPDEPCVWQCSRPY